MQDGFAKWAQEPVTVQPIDAAGVKALVKNDSDKLRLINVWATWCGPCTVEFPDLVTIHRMYRGREFEVVTISSDPADARAGPQDISRQNSRRPRRTSIPRRTPTPSSKPWIPSGKARFPTRSSVAPGGKVLYRCNGAFDSLALKKAIVGWLGRYFHSVPGK